MPTLRAYVTHISQSLKNRPRRLSNGWGLRGANLSARRLNFLAKHIGERIHYLEIGLDRGRTFEAVKAHRKIGVDPEIGFLLDSVPSNSEIVLKTSDEFFRSYTGKSFSLVFLDGLHEAQQTYRDLINSLNLLKPGGIIVVDDVSPKNEASALPQQNAAKTAVLDHGLRDYGWFGDVYKVVGAIAHHHPELQCELVGSESAHVQALVWRKNPQTVGYQVRPEVVAKIDSWGFSDFFSARPICSLSPTKSEKETLAAVFATHRY